MNSNKLNNYMYIIMLLVEGKMISSYYVSYGMNCNVHTID